MPKNPALVVTKYNYIGEGIRQVLRNKKTEFGNASSPIDARQGGIGRIIGALDRRLRAYAQDSVEIPQSMSEQRGRVRTESAAGAAAPGRHDGRRSTTVKRIGYILLALGLIMGMFAPSPAAAAEKVVVVAQGVDATTMIPDMESVTSTTNVLENIYDTLVWRTPDLELEPALATDWRAIDDLTWEFTLRRGVKWHDGTEFTAEDVKFTLDYIMDPSVGSQFAAYFTPLDRVEVVDDYTVRFITKDPFPLLLARLSMTQIMSKKYMESHSKEYLATHPMGTGPFRFVEWVKDERIVLEKNPDHWRGAPDIDRLIFRPIPESSTRLAELLTGQVDVITNVSPDHLEDIERSRVARVSRVPSLRVIYMNIDTLSPGPLQNPKVRQAINYAIDREAIIDALLGGNGQPLKSGGLSPYHFGHVADSEGFTYDPDRARQLLAEAGYPNGFPIHVIAPSGRYLRDRDVAEAVAGFLEDIGLDVSYNVYEWGVYWGMISDRKASGRKAGDLALLGWGGATVDAEGTFGPLLYSKAPLSWFSHEEVDRLIDAGRTTVDVNERLDVYRQLISLLDEEAPWLYLYQQMDLYGVSNRIDWEARADERLWMYPVRVLD